MKKIILNLGLPRSGKSTFSKEYKQEHKNVEIQSYDSIRQELYGDYKIQGDIFHIMEVFWSRVKSSNADVLIVDNTNTVKEYREDMLKKLRELFPNTPIFINQFETPITIVKQRCIDTQFSLEVLDRFIKSFEPITKEEIEKYNLIVNYERGV